MLNVYPWGISANVVRPLAVDRTRVSFPSYVWILRDWIAAPARLSTASSARTR